MFLVFPGHDRNKTFTWLQSHGLKPHEAGLLCCLCSYSDMAVFETANIWRMSGQYFVVTLYVELDPTLWWWNLSQTSGIVTCAATEHRRDKAFQLSWGSVAVSAHLLVSCRDDCCATEMAATPGNSLSLLSTKTAFFSELRPMLYVKCHGSIWVGLLHDCYALITLLKCHNNWCMFVYQDSRNKSSPLFKMAFSLCFLSPSTIQVRSQCQINSLSCNRIHCFFKMSYFSHWTQY